MNLKVTQKKTKSNLIFSILVIIELLSNFHSFLHGSKYIDFYGCMCVYKNMNLVE